MRERVIASVEQAVLWGESRDEVFAMMAVNGIISEDADQIYREAVAKRISTLRGIGFRIFAKGILILAAAVGVYVWFYYVQGRMTRGVFVASGMGGFYGL